MQEKVYLITGATSGIGKATALELAKTGANVVLIARSQPKGEAVKQELSRQSGNANITVLLADLSSQVSVRQLAADFLRQYDRLDGLINNAGGVWRERTLTADGLEMTFAVNHLAPFLLTNLLLERLKSSTSARVVTVSSSAQGFGRINFENLQGEQRYGSFRAYSQSKLANVLFTYELARRLAGTGVTANCVHPGAVNSNFGRENPSFLVKLLTPLVTPFMRTPAKGAETVVYLAASHAVEGVSGKYFADKEVKKSSKQSYDLALAAHLWQVSEALTSPVAKNNVAVKKL